MNTCLKSFRHALLEYCFRDVCVYWEGKIGACGYYLCGWTSFGGRGVATLYSCCIMVGVIKTWCIRRCCKTWWRRHVWSVWLLYVAAARLGGGGMFDQCGYYMSLLQDLVEEACLISVVTICRCCKTWWRRHVWSVWLLYVTAAILGRGGMFDQCGYYISLLQNLVEEACLISVVTICRCCKTWWRRHVWSVWLLYVAAARLGGGGMFDQCGYYMSLLQDLVEEACLISVITICRCCKTCWRRHVWSVWLLYVAAARLGGGGLFDQCGYYMSLLQDLVEEACLISVVTICRCCKTWWRRHVWSVWLLYVTAARLGGGGMFDQCGYYMSLLQDLVEGACLISVVIICRCCKTWWRGHVWSVWLLYVAAARLGGGGMFDQCGYYMSLLQDLVEGACLISVVIICRCCKTWWRRHVWSVWLLYVAAARLGGGGMFDQCGYYMSLLQDLVEEECLISVVTICRCCKTWWRGHVWPVWLLYVSAARLGGGGMFDQCDYYMSLLQDLVEGACLISVVTICHCCKTWWRGHVWSVWILYVAAARLGGGGMFDQCG